MGERVRRLRPTSLVPVWITVAVMVPVLASAVTGIRSGWWPIGDEALTALSAWDVLHGHPPVMGPRTTTAFETGIETHHPGPILYYLLAIPSAIASGDPWGLLIGCVLITLALVVTGVGVTHRLGGLLPAACVGAAFLGVLWALGPDAATRPFNPYPPAIAVITWFVLTWALLGERLRYLPHYVVTISLMIQSHIGYLPFVAGPLLGLIAVGMWRWWSRRRAIWPAKGWRPTDSGRYRVDVRIALLLGFVMWLPPLIELITFAPNNLTQVLRYVGAPRGDSVSSSDAVRFVLGMQAPIPQGFTDAGAGRGVAHAHLVRHPRSSLAAAVGCGVVVVLVAIAIARWRRPKVTLPPSAHRWLPTRRERDAAVVAIGGVLALTLTVMSLPKSSVASTWNYLQTWPVVLFGWAVLVTFLLRRVLHRRSGRSNPQFSLIASAAVLAVGMGLAFASPVPARWQEGEGVASVLPTIEKELEAIQESYGDELLHVSFDGDNLGAGYYLAPSIAYALHDDYAIHLPAIWKNDEDTDFRKTRTAPDDSAWLSIRHSRKEAGADGVDPRSEVIAHLTDVNGAVYTIFLRGPSPDDT